ncbi:NEK10 [Blepharisma stoltei]|uniref:Protein kinase domain-containing protein n=1 Tax=Blepharisma stoltei TaxID=1481888 RepID=A0AAU9K4M1_9CILI|nr:unnamed protein product [Blepharisma stoltei]
MKDNLISPLLSSLDDNPSMEERDILDSFINTHTDKYTFPPVYAGLLAKIFTARLSIEQFVLNNDFYSYVLKILQTLRILTRDPSLLPVIFEIQGTEILGRMLKNYATQHFSNLHAKHLSEMLVELATIIRRMAENDQLIKQLLKFEIPEVLTLMLGSSHAIVARGTLEALIALSKDQEMREVLEKTSIVELLLRIISEYEGEFIQLASNLLNVMCHKEEMSRQVRLQRGNLIMMNAFQKSKDLASKLYLSRVILTLCMDTENVREYKNLGLISLLLKVIGSSEHPLEVINALKLITEMTLDDETAVYIRTQGAHLISYCLIQYHPLNYPEGLSDEIKPGLYEIQLNALQCIRFLYSIERNRKYFRRIFPPHIFASFIDVGNYIKDITAYQGTLKIINSISQSELETIEKGIQEMKETQDPAQGREIGGYVIGELIGKGAFGTVFEATKGGNRYALKEIPLQDFENDFEEESIDKLAEKLSKEVAIYKNLNHPNIIQYFTSFVANENLYIVMELIEGQPLSDFITSVKEKGQRLVEGQIWRIFIEMCAGLRYLHLDKRVVHRDFTPANIMITRDNHVKIADFGLAKQRGGHSSGHMNAFVGTIQYSCPEIVRSQPYTEKADIWSLGVILYELATLSQPFSGENPLAIARKIVEEDYTPITAKDLSPLLINVIKKCMTVNPDQRPDILHISQIIGPVLMLQVDELKTTEMQLRETIKNSAPKSSADIPVVHIKSANLKKVKDPVQPLFQTLHKLIYITQLPPGLQRDPRRSMLESFKHWLFSEPSFANTLKEELGKLHNCSKDEVPILHKERVTYETLNFTIEELLIEKGYYENQEPATAEIISSSIQSPQVKKTKSSY